MTYRLRSLLAALLAFAVPLTVYVLCTRPGVGFWDTGELQTVPYILGIPHPSGFPAYVLIGWVWSHALAVGDPAYRMNLLSAAGMAAAACTLAGALIELDVEPLFALGAALVFAFTRVPWEHATHADVHALALAALGASFWAALRWRRTGSVRALVLCTVAAALALGIHSGTILVVPGIALAAFARRPHVRHILVCVALGITIVGAAYAYLPLRSAVVYAQRLDPTLALGVPPGRPFWDQDHPSTWAGFRAEVGGGEFGTGRALTQLFDPRVLADVPARYGRLALGDLAFGVVIIAFVGAIALLRRSWLAGIGMLTGGFLPVLFVLSYPAESDPERYFLPSYWVIGACLGVGAAMLSRGGLAKPPPAIVALVAALFFLVAGGNVYANRGSFNQSPDMSAQRFVDRVLRETPSNAILVTPWLYATPLAYSAYVEKRLGNRIVLTGWPADYAADYPRWLTQRPVVFVSDNPALVVDGVRIRENDVLGPAPHLFAANVSP